MSQSQPFLMQAPGCSHIRTSPEAYVLSRNPTAKFTNRMWQPEWKGSSHRQRAVTNRHIMVSMVFRAIPFPQELVAGPTGQLRLLSGPQRHRSKVSIGTVFISSNTTRPARMRGSPAKKAAGRNLAVRGPFRIPFP